MAKKFAYVSFGILCLVMAYQLGAERARADAGTAIYALGHNGWVLDTAGQAWNITAASCWERMPGYDIPVQISNVLMWDNHALITNAGIAWRNDGAGGWVECGPHPDTPVSVEPPVSTDSWTKIKSRYR